MLKRANVILCCDADPEWESHASTGSKSLSWKGVSLGIPRFNKRVSDLENDRGVKVHVNWFFRSDLQMETAYGNPAWPFNAWRSAIDSVARRGDEIGWHPHFWRLHTDGASWFQETENKEYMGLCLRKGFNAIPPELRPRIARTGWSFHNAFTMSFLSDLGIVADLSALPGVKDAGVVDSRTSKRIAIRDWAGAPDRPYTPSRSNHKQEAKHPADRLGIIEIPVSTYKLPTGLQIVRNMRSRLRGTKPRSRFSEPYLTKSSKLFRAAIDYHLTERDAVNVPFVVEFHADELLRDRGSYSLGNVLKNISMVEDSYRKAGMQPSFSRASSVARELSEKRRE